jgi:multiple sugar transport system substrate-binding protein
VGVLVSIGAAVLVGCGYPTKQSPPAAPPFQGLSLQVGALDHGDLLGGAASQRGEWVASRGAAVTFLERPVTLESLGQADVLLFAADRLGDLLDKGALATIPNDAVMPRQREETAEGEARTGDASAESEPKDTLNYMDVVPAYRDHVTRYGRDRVALPYGGSALVLVYRRDAFERAQNRASASEKGLSLSEPPGTWDQLDAVARFFQGRDWDGDGKPDFGIAFALRPDAEGVASATFLARSASLGQHPDHFSFVFDSETMTPRIDTPPFVEALSSLIALVSAGPTGLARFDTEAARESFRTGRVAMLIDRAERVATWSHGKPIGVAALPGSDRVFEPALKKWVPGPRTNAPSYLPRGGGWLIGVRSGLGGSQRDAAVDFAKYLAGPESSIQVRADRAFPMLPFRSSQMGLGLPDPTSAPDVDFRLWSAAVTRTLLAERVVLGLRIPGSGGYLEDLAGGTERALGGEPPQQALEGVARAWTARTQARGPKRQQWHYRRSLNLRAMSPEPPPGT